jgi:hypothetical protein
MLQVNQLIGFGAASGGGSGFIEFVGYAFYSKANGVNETNDIALNSGLTGGIAAAVSNGDLVVAVYSTGSIADRTLSITDGSTPYTLIGSELYSNDAVDTNLRVAYKFVSGDTLTRFGTQGDANDGGVTAVYVFRGVDQSSPLDVAAVTATAINSVLANPPAITPVTPGAWILAIGAGAFVGFPNTFTSPDLSGFQSRHGPNTSYDSVLGIGYKNDWTSGAFNPAQFTFSDSDDGDNSWAAMTLALRPA